MRYLIVGRRVRAISDDAARAWPAVVARADEEAAADDLPAIVWLRTDRGVTGTIPIRHDLPATIANVGQPSELEYGTIVQVSADFAEVAAAAAATRGPEPERSDAEIRELVDALKIEKPNLDWDNLLTGRLAGPASSDRPNVPVWDYLAYARDHPEVPFSDLTAARFPVRYFEGPWSVTSIDEELRPFPSSYKGNHPKPRYIETAETVISRYAALHEAGLIEWDPEERGIVHLKPIGAQYKVLGRWIKTLKPAE